MSDERGLRLLGVLAVVCAGLLGCSEAPQLDRVGIAAALARTVAAEQDHVTVTELSDWLIRDQRDFELVDVRDPAEFDAGHIRNARNVPLAGLMSDAALLALPVGRKVVVYSNGTAHAAQAAILLRLVDRDAYALLGGYNHWLDYLHDPQAAGVAEMDPARRAQYQAVACFFAGDYVADAGLVPKAVVPEARPAGGPADPLGLGLDLGLGTGAVGAGPDAGAAPSGSPGSDPLGLGLGLGLGTDAVRAPPQAPAPGSKKLLIKAEC